MSTTSKNRKPRNQYQVGADHATLITHSGAEVLVDNDAVDLLRAYTWCVSGNGSVMSRTKGPATILHRLLLNAQPGDFVDHINGNPLDNRKSNLRVCSKQQNEFNTKVRKDNTSGYRGVCRTRAGRFRAYINRDGKQYNLGVYATPEEAAVAYNLKAAELFGAYARPNLIPQT